MNPYPDPKTVDGPPYSRRHARNRAKEEMGFDKDPPRCATCRWFNAHHDGHPTAPVENQAPHCRFGHFAVAPHSVCDRWAGPDGETLAL